MAQKNRANMLTDIVSNIYNNLINFITGQNAQDRFVNLLDSSPNILSDASQPNGYVSTDANNEMFSTYYNENDTRANIITKQGLGELVGNKFYQINDADGNTRTLQICAENALLLHNFAIDVQTGETGEYDITTDVFTPIVVSGTPTLSQVLTAGNTSGANDIEFDAAQGLLFANTSRLREGTIDAGLGGLKGIAQICGAGYELKWENGRLYVMGNGGTTIRQSLYNFTTTPTATDDTTKGYAVGSLWTLDDGTTYICSDATATAAVWAIGGIPDLQQVTDVGFTTTNRLVSDDGVGNYTDVGNGYVQIATGNTGDVNIDSSLVTASYVAQLPDKPTSPQTFAMLSDITGGGLDLEVNGIANVDQTLLNLIEGVNIDIADNGTGGVTITSLADRYSTSSLTSVLIGNGSKTFTVDANLAYIPLQEVLIVYDPSNHMHATVTSYSGTTLVVDVKTHTGGGTYALWVLNLDGVPVDAITGVGIANEIAYFTSGQVIASLPVATYPSLTELSYVKGVTSAIQTQLNAIEKPISSVGNGTAVTGVVVNTYSKGLLIPANSRTANDVVQIDCQVAKTGTAGNIQLRYYWNTTNDITTGSPILLGTSVNGAANWTAFSRLLSIEVANGSGNGTKVAPTTVVLQTGWGTATAAPNILAINWGVDGYLICAILNSNAADSSVCHMLKLF
jgi:hypothetical protein